MHSKSARPSIIVLHGALGSAEQMQPVAMALGDVGEVLTIELPGHGSTALGSMPFGIEAFTDALNDAVETIALYDAPTVRGGEGVRRDRQSDAQSEDTRPIVFGYSMGGYVALALEATRPGTLRGIVTLGTKFLWTPEVAAREAARLDTSTIMQKVPRFASALEARHAGCGGWQRVVERTRALLLSLGEDPLLTTTTAANVRIPVTIAVGDSDDTVTAREAREVATWMHEARTAVLPDTPHPIERVPVAAIVSLVRQHLAV